MSRLCQSFSIKQTQLIPRDFLSVRIAAIKLASEIFGHAAAIPNVRSARRFANVARLRQSNFVPQQRGAFHSPRDRFAVLIPPVARLALQRMPNVCP